MNTKIILSINVYDFPKKRKAFTVIAVAILDQDWLKALSKTKVGHGGTLKEHRGTMREGTITGEGQ